MRTSFLTDSNFLFLGKFSYLHAKYRAQLVLRIHKDMLELPTGIWRHDCFSINSPIFYRDQQAEVCFSTDKTDIAHLLK